MISLPLIEVDAEVAYEDMEIFPTLDVAMAAAAAAAEVTLRVALIFFCLL